MTTKIIDQPFIYDGDTFYDDDPSLNPNAQGYRSDGVNTTEMGREGSAEARDRFRELVDGQPITFEQRTRGHYGRPVGTPYNSDGLNIDAQLHREGHSQTFNFGDNISPYAGMPQDIPDWMRQINWAVPTEEGDRREAIANRTVLQEVGAGVRRGTDQVQGMGYGFVGAMGDFLGMDSVREWGIEGLQRNMVEAMENPAQVASYTDIDDIGDFGYYAIGAISEFLPQVASMFAGGVVGRVAAAGIGTALRRKLGEKAYSHFIQQKGRAMIASQERVDRATSLLAQKAHTKLKNAGTKAGAVGAIYAQTTGENVMEGLEHGVMNGGASLVVGAVNAGMEYLAVGKILGDVMKTVKKGDKLTATQVVRKGFENFGVEATQEAAQDIVNQLSIMAQSDKEFDHVQLVDSFLKGGIAGGAATLTGGFGRMGLDKLGSDLTEDQKLDETDIVPPEMMEQMDLDLDGEGVQGPRPERGQDPIHARNVEPDPNQGEFDFDQPLDPEQQSFDFGPEDQANSNPQPDLRDNVEHANPEPGFDPSQPSAPVNTPVNKAAAEQLQNQQQREGQGELNFGGPENFVGEAQTKKNSLMPQGDSSLRKQAADLRNPRHPRKVLTVPHSESKKIQAELRETLSRFVFLRNGQFAADVYTTKRALVEAFGKAEAEEIINSGGISDDQVAVLHGYAQNKEQIRDAERSIVVYVTDDDGDILDDEVVDRDNYEAAVARMEQKHNVDYQVGGRRVDVTTPQQMAEMRRDGHVLVVLGDGLDFLHQERVPFGKLAERKAALAEQFPGRKIEVHDGYDFQDYADEFAYQRSKDAERFELPDVPEQNDTPASRALDRRRNQLDQRRDQAVRNSGMMGRIYAIIAEGNNFVDAINKTLQESVDSTNKHIQDLIKGWQNGEVGVEEFRGMFVPSLTRQQREELRKRQDLAGDLFPDELDAAQPTQNYVDGGNPDNHGKQPKQERLDLQPQPKEDENPSRAYGTRPDEFDNSYSEDTTQDDNSADPFLGDELIGVDPDKFQQLLDKHYDRNQGPQELGVYESAEQARAELERLAPGVKQEGEKYVQRRANGSVQNEFAIVHTDEGVMLIRLQKQPNMEYIGSMSITRVDGKYEPQLNQAKLDELEAQHKEGHLPEERHGPFDSVADADQFIESQSPEARKQNGVYTDGKNTFHVQQRGRKYYVSVKNDKFDRQRAELEATENKPSKDVAAFSTREEALAALEAILNTKDNKFQLDGERELASENRLYQYGIREQDGGFYIVRTRIPKFDQSPDVVRDMTQDQTLNLDDLLDAELGKGSKQAAGKGVVIYSTRHHKLMDTKTQTPNNEAVVGALKQLNKEGHYWTAFLKPIKDADGRITHYRVELINVSRLVDKVQRVTENSLGETVDKPENSQVAYLTLLGELINRGYYLYRPGGQKAVIDPANLHDNLLVSNESGLRNGNVLGRKGASVGARKNEAIKNDPSKGPSEDTFPNLLQDRIDRLIEKERDLYESLALAKSLEKDANAAVDNTMDHGLRHTLVKSLDKQLNDLRDARDRLEARLKKILDNPPKGVDGTFAKAFQQQSAWRLARIWDQISRLEARRALLTRKLNAREIQQELDTNEEQISDLLSDQQFQDFLQSAQADLDGYKTQSELNERDAAPEGKKPTDSATGGVNPITRHHGYEGIPQEPTEQRLKLLSYDMYPTLAKLYPQYTRAQDEARLTPNTTTQREKYAAMRRAAQTEFGKKRGKYGIDAGSHQLVPPAVPFPKKPKRDDDDNSGGSAPTTPNKPAPSGNNGGTNTPSGDNTLRNLRGAKRYIFKTGYHDTEVTASAEFDMFDHKFVIHKALQGAPGKWTVSEASSGASVAHADTVADAYAAAVKRINDGGKDFLDKAVKNYIENKPKSGKGNTGPTTQIRRSQNVKIDKNFEAMVNEFLGSGASSILSEVRTIVEELVAELGISARIDELRPSQHAEAADADAYLMPNTDGSVDIFLSPQFMRNMMSHDPLERLQSILILAHELGHVSVTEMLDAIPSDVRKVLWDDFQRTRAKRNDRHQYNSEQEHRAFNEYLADQVSGMVARKLKGKKFSGNSYLGRIADTLVAYFKKIGNLLRLALDVIDQRWGDLLGTDDTFVQELFEDFYNKWKTDPQRPDFGKNPTGFLRKFIEVNDYRATEFRTSDHVKFNKHAKRAVQAVERGVAKHPALKPIASAIGKVLGVLTEITGRLGFTSWRRLAAIDEAIANKFSDYLREKQSANARFANRVFDVEKKFGKARFQRALKYMQKETSRSLNVPAGLKPVVDALGLILNDIHKFYQNETNANLPGSTQRGLKFRHNFFPRIYDGEKLKENQHYEAFVNLLTDPNSFVDGNAMDRDQAEIVANKIINEENEQYEGQFDTSELLNVAPGARGHISSRSLNTLKSGVVQDYLADPETVIYSYIQSMTRRAVSNKHFGGMDDLQAAVNRMTHAAAQGLPTNRNVYDAMNAMLANGETEVYNPTMVLDEKVKELLGRNEHDRAQEFSLNVEAQFGRIRTDLPQSIRTANSVLNAIQFYSTLAFAVTANFMDLGVIALRTRSLDGFRQVAKALKTPRQAMEYAKQLGLYNASNMANATAMLHGEQYFDQRTQKLNDLFFKYNGLEYFTRMSRGVAAMAGKNFLDQHLAKAKRGNKRSQHYLRELGIHDYRTELTQAQRDAAIVKFADSAVVRPDAASRPVWASDPLFLTIWALKSYFYTFGHKVIGGLIREIQWRFKHEGLVNAVAPLALAAVATLPLVILGLEVREFLQYQGIPALANTFVDLPPKTPLTDDQDLGEYTWNIINRSGWLGPLEIAAGAGKYDEPAIVSLLGPTANTIDTFVNDGLWDGLVRIFPLVNQTPALRQGAKDLGDDLFGEDE